ncbi:MAG TPA: hypothetical protein VK066_21945 [Chloroflexota bacterium]|nr:hypothetical protein [Chloroflexota bacterium]
MLSTADALAFDGRDVTDPPVPDAVLGYGLVSCPCCGALRDVRYPYCCEFAAEAMPQALAAAV